MTFPSLRSTLVGLSAVGIWLSTTSTHGQDLYDAAPIRYRDSEPDNCVSRLQTRLDAGQTALRHQGEHGYLPALLQALQVPIESQMLVFSKTSLQVRYINVQSPRAIYFNDEVYIGYCRGGDVLEISAVDPRLGTVFYTLDQQPTDAPRLERRIDNCTMCHSSSSTDNVPGHLVRSLYIDADGQPIFSAGGRTVNHTTPLSQRWGGWYVTGQHGAQTHLGNLVIRTRDIPQPLDNSAGENVTSLANRIRVDRYLTPHSDLVALLVLEHQTMAHNRITRTNFTVRQILAEADVLRQVDDATLPQQLADIERRIRQAGDALLDVLLFVDEAPLTAAISGTSGFERWFEQQGPRDKQGRSLREFDLERRLFRYPCSYLIHSAAFDGLPREVRDYVWRKLGSILTATQPEPKYAQLSSADRTALVEILRDTHRKLPDNWLGAP